MAKCNLRSNYLELKNSQNEGGIILQAHITINVEYHGHEREAWKKLTLENWK